MQENIWKSIKKDLMTRITRFPKKNTGSNTFLYETESKTNKDKVIFAGRLAEYKYYNMDQIVARALHLFEKEINTEKDNKE